MLFFVFFFPLLCSYLHKVAPLHRMRQLKRGMIALNTSSFSLISYFSSKLLYQPQEFT